MAIESQGTTLEIETGTGAAITAVTAAVGFPTIITKTAHGLNNGDVVALSAFAGASATLMNGFTVIVKNVTANTLAVDIDTTGGTLTAANGTLTPQTYTALGEVIDFDGPGGSASVIDTTHLASSAREKMIGLRDEGQFTFSLNAAFDDTGQQAFRASREDRTLKSYKVTYPDGTVQSFDGYALEFSTSGGVDDKLNASATIEITGEVTTV
jgi:hypothetical protein